MKTSPEDGAFAWLLCAASFLNILMTGGFLYASGMFYLMFKNSLDATDSEVALIISINISAMHFICPIAGLLSNKYGLRCVSIIGSVLTTAALTTGAFSTKAYHLYLNYGLLSGIGLGTVYNCSVTILDPYFKKYKRTALGLAFSGLGVGSFIFPPILNIFEDIYGWRGALLLLAGVNAHMTVFSSLFIPFRVNHYRNNDTLTIGNASFGDEFNPSDKHANVGNTVERKTVLYKAKRYLSLFKIIPYLCLMVATLILFFAVSIIITHFGSYVITLGFTDLDVIKLYMTFGLSATISRPLSGIIAQAINANTGLFITLAAFINGTITLCLPFINQLWMLYVYAAIFQLMVSQHTVLGPIIVMEHLPKSQVNVAFGLYNVAAVPGYAFGAPMAAWLHSSTGVYSSSFFLAGGIALLAGISMAPAAYHIQRKKT